jgi:hypothetical protein
MNIKTIKTHWDWAIAGTGICPICHRAKKPWHVPANCPLLKTLNLKLVNGPPSTSAPAPSASPAPAPATSPPNPSPGGQVASADSADPVGSGVTPLGLTAAVEEDEYSSDEDTFPWTGNEDSLDVGAPLSSPNTKSSPVKSNPLVSLYPSAYHVCVVPLPSPSSSSCLVINDSLHAILRRLAASSFSPDSSNRVAVADTGATDHMFLDKSAFISYK